jgi:hypothetical protein
MNNRRSFLALGCGALLGLLMAGYSLFTARGTSTLIVPFEDVALVNQQPISRSDYLQQLQALYSADWGHATPAQRRKVLDDMIREELFVQRGRELDVASVDPEVRAAMVNAVEQEIAADAVTTQPSEPQLRAYFATHRARYASEGMMSVRDHMLAPGQSPPATPAAAGIAPGEEFYFAAKIHLGDTLFEAARNLPDGGVSAPIAGPNGTHVLYMFKNTRPVPMDFAAARDRVLNDYRNDAIAHLRTGDEAFLRKRANILIADDLRQ